MNCSKKHMKHRKHRVLYEAFGIMIWQTKHGTINRINGVVLKYARPQTNLASSIIATDERKDGE